MFLGVLLLIIWIIGVIWAWIDATDRYGGGMGCLVAIGCFIFWPLILVYALVRAMTNSKDTTQ